MPPRKRPSSVLNGEADDLPREADRVTSADDALAAAEEADAEAAEAEAVAAAARARARAIRLRREASAAAAASAAEEAKKKAEEVESAATEAAATKELDKPSEAPTADAEPVSLEKQPVVDAPEDDAPEDDAPEDDAPEDDAPEDDDASVEQDSVDELEDDLDDARQSPAPAAWKVIAKALVASVALVGSIALLGLSGAMYWHHRNVAAEQTQSAEFAAAARQGVVTLMSLNFNNAKEDVQRIIDNTTGEFKKDFQGQSDAFIKVAQNSKVITEATVSAAAVQSMTKDTATVLVAVTTNVSNKASDKQQPRSWRLKVGMTRDGDRIKLSKVEFVP
jgi:Mce-associated membrane protein